MKTLLKTTAAVIALSAVMAAPASAAVAKNELNQSATPTLDFTPSIKLTKTDEEAILADQLDDAGNTFAAISTTQPAEGIDNGINFCENNIFTSAISLQSKCSFLEGLQVGK